MNLTKRIKQKAQEAENRKQGGRNNIVKTNLPWYELSKGTKRFIILPFSIGKAKGIEELSIGEQWYKAQIYKHRAVGTDNKDIVCPSSFGGRCPICFFRKKQLDAGADFKSKEMTDLRAKLRDLFYIIDLEDGGKLKVWDNSYATFGKKLDEELRDADDDSLALKFAFVKDGAVLRVRFGEKPIGNTSFFEAERIDFDVRTKEEQALVDAVVDTLPSLDSAVIILPYEEIDRIFNDIPEPQEQAPQATAQKAPSEPQKEETQPEPPKQEEKPLEQTSEAKNNESASSCPAGGVFGKEINKHTACDNCDIWSICRDEADRLGLD